MSAPKVLIFGATGAVGSSAAVTAHALGASHITLAMRDTSKPLPPALSETETSHPTSFSRVQADLNDPSTVTSAVQSSGATHAFIYAVFSSPDGMRATIEALKAAGIEWVVLLSSGGLHEDADLKAVTPAKFIEWAHARVEVALQEVFGREGYVAVRPGYFASNLFQYSGQIARGGEVKVVYPEARFDFITPEDIGRVSGKLLVEGKGLLQGVGSNVVMLSGPQQISQGEAVKIIGEVIGKEVKAVGFEDDEDAVKATMENLHLPEPGARQLVQVFKAVASGAEVFDPSQYEKSVANIVKYAGKATVFREWVEENKDKFA